MKTSLLIILTLMMLSCSNQSVYNSIKTNQRMECEKLANQSEYEDCIRKTNPDYEDYERERKHLKENADN